MFLIIRMALYTASSFLAGYGYAVHDAEAGTLTLNLDQIATFLGSAVVFIGTFITSRFARRR
ncbi:hypothetical protein [Falsirhodobacter halotolerans]|uniref:hypothetical protein n=1 Tax=Falsirhodobacter halotolerans TaxID=1146892 RepID=UPI001FD0C1D9|nr:hypothetical protein [Falsirhodobacter halotolerans]MCJ8139334.1 hypothetical protein [Falsirhodobacter halotolerans]